LLDSYTQWVDEDSSNVENAMFAELTPTLQELLLLQQKQMKHQEYSKLLFLLLRVVPQVEIDYL
jgi:hypothetical protein